MLSNSLIYKGLMWEWEEEGERRKDWSLLSVSSLSRNIIVIAVGSHLMPRNKISSDYLT